MLKWKMCCLSCNPSSSTCSKQCLACFFEYSTVLLFYSRFDLLFKKVLPVSTTVFLRVAHILCLLHIITLLQVFNDELGLLETLQIFGENLYRWNRTLYCTGNCVKQYLWNRFINKNSSVHRETNLQTRLTFIVSSIQVELFNCNRENRSFGRSRAWNNSRYW